MPLILQKWISRADLIANPTVVYLYGDNEARCGLGGQAKECRGETNSHGVATLKSPGEFWNEDSVARQCAVLDTDFAPVFQALRDGKIVVFPLDGIGTGLADLKRQSPTTFAYLQTKIEQMKEYNL